MTAKVKKKEGNKCPFCGRKCPGYDQGSRKCVNRGPLTCVALFFLLRQKRSASYAASMVYSIQQSHGPMGQPFDEGFRQDCSMTGPFHLSRNAVAKYLRIDWETEAERIYSSSMTLAVSSSDSAFLRISSYEELSSRAAFNRLSFI